ncbi:MAG: hypothetical protein Q7O12_01965 [Deltaproteobacteria bacterium]|nr:hypothetical protein [Deltaproteobacteria bacterium]
MSMGTNTAKKCFAENLQLFANAQSQPEKFNLYNGLHGLAEAIESLESRIAQIEHNLQIINNNITLLKR